MCYHGTEEWEEVRQMMLEEEPEEEFKEDRSERIQEEKQEGKEPVPADD
jgi:hypothetical protein